MKNENHFKNGDKGQERFNKMLNYFVGKKKRNERVSTLLWAKGYVGWKNLVLKITLKWLQGCQKRTKLK